MATKHQQVTATPTVLAGTVEDTEYAVQNVARSTVLISTAAAVPDPDDDPRFLIEYGRFGYPTAASGESIYIWSRDGAGMVSFEEA